MYIFKYSKLLWKVRLTFEVGTKSGQKNEGAKNNSKKPTLGYFKSLDFPEAFHQNISAWRIYGVCDESLGPMDLVVSAFHHAFSHNSPQPMVGWWWIMAPELINKNIYIYITESPFARTPRTGIVAILEVIGLLCSREACFAPRPGNRQEKPTCLYPF